MVIALSSCSPKMTLTSATESNRYAFPARLWNVCAPASTPVSHAPHTSCAACRGEQRCRGCGGAACRPTVQVHMPLRTRAEQFLCWIVLCLKEQEPAASVGTPAAQPCLPQQRPALVSGLRACGGTRATALHSWVSSAAVLPAPSCALQPGQHGQ